MRDFFIRSFEVIVGLLVIVMSVGVLIAGLAAMAGAGQMMGGQGGFFAGLAILVVGALYVLFIGGAMYLGLGIYQNTRRTADALERLAAARD
ncbi:hypothetical protein [Pararhodobacter sp. SW119]|uniref:hypothetical protein n=1 Tax=Pararhodobacter sp. SW119 TaxID=2780075 RepID=UPI001ADF17A1|nr:hypothetical protein [Pararhodobacter sp. SW119]